jgi:hypothetical protein
MSTCRCVVGTVIEHTFAVVEKKNQPFAAGTRGLVLVLDSTDSGMVGDDEGGDTSHGGEAGAVNASDHDVSPKPSAAARTKDKRVNRCVVFCSQTYRQHVAIYSCTCNSLCSCVNTAWEIVLPKAVDYRCEDRNEVGVSRDDIGDIR